MKAISVVHDMLDDAADRHSGRPAVRLGPLGPLGPRGMSYATMRDRSVKLAAWLARNGLRHGDRVLIATPPDEVLPALAYACSRAGGIFVLVRDTTPTVVAEHIMHDAEPALVISDSPVMCAVAARNRVPHHGLAEVREAAAGALSSPAPPASPAPPGGPRPADPVCFIYTSGSTAMPKAVVSTHAQVTFAAQAIASQLGYTGDDVVYCQLPLSFDYGLYQVFLCTLAGAELCLASGESPAHTMLAGLSQCGASVAPVVPSLAAGLARLLRHRSPPLSRLRLLTSTGAAMPPSVLTELRDRVPGLHVQLMYGLTECKRATIMPEDEDLRRPGACGRALPGTEVFTVGEEGAPLPAGQIGEVIVRGPNVMAGYWRQPELTRQRFRRAEGLAPELRTGDFGWLDDDGYLYFAGRQDDLYKERGFRVSATEVEAAAYRVPGIRAAAVRPPADGESGATLLVETGLRPLEVLRQLRDQLDEAKIPARCVVVPELPLNANGKIERARLASEPGIDG